MQNVLVKEPVVTVTPGKPGSLGHPGQAYVPARWVDVPEYRATYMSTDDWNALVKKGGTGMSSKGGVLLPLYKNASLVPRTAEQIATMAMYPPGSPRYIAASMQLVLVYKLHWVSVFVPYQPYIPAKPAVPATPASIVRSLNIGWNSGARSIPSLQGMGGFCFKVPSSVTGVVLGLGTSDPDGGITSMGPSLHLINGVANAMWAGEVRKNLGAFDSNTEWLIFRDHAGLVSILKDGESKYSFSASYIGTVFLDTSLYSAGDSVGNPAIVLSGQSSLTMPSAQAYSEGYVAETGGANIRLPALLSGGYGPLAESVGGSLVLPRFSVQGAGYADNFASAEVRLLTVEGGGAGPLSETVLPLPIPPEFIDPYNPPRWSDTYALGGAVFPAMRAHGTNLHSYCDATLPLPSIEASSTGSLPEASISGAMFYLTRPLVSALSLVGEVGEGEVVIPTFEAKAYDAPFAEALCKFPAFTVMAQYDDMSTADMRCFGVSVDEASGVGAEILTMIVKAQAMMYATPLLVAIENIAAMGQSSSTLQAIGEILAELLAYAAGITPLPDPEAESFAWATTEGGMVTRYSGYHFQSFAEIDGRYYGVRTDGVFLLQGTDDDSQAISAEVNFGGTDFGDAALKSLPNVYTGVRVSDGALFLKVETIQGEFVYLARRVDSRMSTQRFDLGRGLRDNWFDFTLVADGVTAFELDNIEFLPAVSKRRI